MEMDWRRNNYWCDCAHLHSRSPFWPLSAKWNRRGLSNDEANPVTWLTSVSLARYPLRTADATESNPETGWDDGVFRDHDDAVADEVVICIQVRRFAFGCDYDAISDADVLIDDGAVDHAIASDAHTRLR